jgi:hypothetical protein
MLPCYKVKLQQSLERVAEEKIHHPAKKPQALANWSFYESHILWIILPLECIDELSLITNAGLPVRLKARGDSKYSNVLPMPSRI